MTKSYRRMIAVFALATTGCAVFSGISGSRGDQGQEDFLIGALQRFRAAGIPQQAAAAAAIDEWKQGRASFEQTYQTIAFIAEENEVESEVTIETRRRGDVTEGAVVKYRFTDKPGVRSANDLSTAIEHMTIGIYHIWSERDGSPTSSTTREFQIWRTPESVTLAENN